MRPVGRLHLLVHSILCLPIIQNNNLIKGLASYETLTLFLPVIMFPKICPQLYFIKFDKIDFCHALLQVTSLSFTLLIFEELIFNIKGIHGIIFITRQTDSRILQGGSDYLWLKLIWGENESVYNFYSFSRPIL